MPATEAQIRANQSNAQRSTGPRTSEGKAISRANAFKHGLTGAGIVMPDGDLEEIDRRAASFVAEMKPETAMGDYFVRRAAVLSVRMTRCTEQTAEVVATRVDKALRDLDDTRAAEAAHLFDALGDDPLVILRKLLRTEEGVRRLLNAWADLKEDLAQDRWKSCHGLRLCHLKGYRADDCGVSFLIELSEALQGRFDPQQFSQATPVDVQGRRLWAKETLTPIIDAEIEALMAFVDRLDPAELEYDQADAIARAKLDAAPDVQQIQKYEAATERNLFRTLKEARLFEIAPKLIEQAKAPRPKTPDATPIAIEASTPLGSFSQNPVEPQSLPSDEDCEPLTPEERAAVEQFFVRMGIPCPLRNNVTGEVGETVTSSRQDE